MANAEWERLYRYCIDDSIKHNGRCDSDLKKYFKFGRLNRESWLHVTLYLASPKLYRLMKKVHLAMFLATHRQEKKRGKSNA